MVITSHLAFGCGSLIIPYIYIYGLLMGGSVGGLKGVRGGAVNHDAGWLNERFVVCGMNSSQSVSTAIVDN